MSAEIQQAVEQLNLAQAESFFAVTVHRDARGHAIPTITCVPNEGCPKELGEEMHRHVSAIADTLRKVYAAKDGAS